MSNPSPVSFGAARLIVPEQPLRSRDRSPPRGERASALSRKKCNPGQPAKRRRYGDAATHRAGTEPPSGSRSALSATPETRTLKDQFWVDRRKGAMAKGCFVVRAEVPDKADRIKFDDWYATDHLPWAIKAFGAQRGWRCWSRTDPSTHYAFYEFADVGEAEALIGSEKIKP